MYIIRNSRAPRKPEKREEMNEMIRDKEVRLVGPEGEQLGIMSGKDAYFKAQEFKMDLVKIAPQAKPPVCKIMDYGKHKYEQQKRDKEAKKKQKQVQVKEIRLSLSIDKHDLDTKAKNAAKFLSKGDKVKVSLRFKGREMGHKDQGFEVFNRFAEIVAEEGEMEARPRIEGRFMNAMFTPKKS